MSKQAMKTEHIDKRRTFLLRSLIQRTIEVEIFRAREDIEEKLASKQEVFRRQQLRIIFLIFVFKTNVLKFLPK